MANATIPPEVIEQLKASADLSAWKDNLQKFPDQAWLDLLTQDKLSVDARKAMATACEGHPEYLQVVIRLADQTSLGEAIARQIVAEPNWSRLQAQNERAGLPNAHSKEQLAASLSKLVVNRDLMFMFLGILFSRPSMAAIAGLFIDNDKAVRLEAVRVLGTFEISDAQQALVSALDDTDQKVREEALAILKAKLPEEDLVEILRSARERAESMQSAVKSAKDTLFNLPSNVPGLGKVVGVMKGAFSAATVVAGGVAGAAGQAASSIGSAASSMASRFGSWRSDNSDCCDPNTITNEKTDALFALLVAMAWADGTISPADQQKLETFVEDGGVPSALWKYVHSSAELSDLTPFLLKLNDPAKAVAVLSKTLAKKTTPQSQEWLQHLAAILDVPESCFAGR